MTVLTAIGLMSGTSLDGIDVALLRTDGEAIVEPGPAHFVSFSRDMKVFMRRAIKAALEGRDGAADIGKAAGELTQAYAIAIGDFLEREKIKRTEVDVIGMSGQTILHRPRRTDDLAGRSWQIGDGGVLAEETKIDVVSDFRSLDIREGGEGAPLAPIYHAALVRSLEPDGAVGVLNIGGVANVTYIAKDASDLDIVAFDCGPGNGLIDEWIELKTGAAMDAGGALARRGKVHSDILRMMLLNPFLRRKPPKSLDRYDFRLEPVLGLSTEDGAATLTAFTAACVRASCAHLPDDPNDWVVVGGGRRNAALMEALGKALQGDVHSAESVGWRGDSLEAECFAYLAVRSLRKLPLSFPKTTRAPRPLTGGVHHRAPA